MLASARFNKSGNNYEPDVNKKNNQIDDSERERDLTGAHAFDGYQEKIRDFSFRSTLLGLLITSLHRAVGSIRCRFSNRHTLIMLTYLLD